jgi:hypothetical protein
MPNIPDIKMEVKGHNLSGRNELSWVRTNLVASSNEASDSNKWKLLDYMRKCQLVRRTLAAAPNNILYLRQ